MILLNDLLGLDANEIKRTRLKLNIILWIYINQIRMR